MRKRDLIPRQRECLEGRRQHMTAKQIGRQLNISHNTVAMHCRMARLKMESDDPETRFPGVTQSRDKTHPPVSGRGHGWADWSSLMATALLILAGALSIIFLLAAASVAIAHSLSLSFQKPFYNLFG